MTTVSDAYFHSSGKTDVISQTYFSFITIGYVLSFGFASLFEKNGKYVHMNLGISKMKLFFMLFLMNGCVSIVLSIIYLFK